MTQVIIDDILPRTQAVATGGQTVFSTDWTANYASDVEVFQRGAAVAADDATQQLNSSQFSVAFIGGSLTVQVTLVSGATAGDIVTIIRNTPADRENLYTNTNFTPSMLNNDFGILTLVDQQAQLVNQQIGPRYNYSAIIEPLVDTILPILPANNTWVKDSADDAIIPYFLPEGGVAPANATYVLLSANSDLANAFALNSLGQGLLVNVPGVPEMVVTTILGTANQITVTNGSGLGGNIGLSIPANPIMPGTGSMGIPTGNTAQRSSTPQDGWFRYNNQIHMLEYYSTVTASWLQVGNNGAVLPGTQNDLAYYASTGVVVSPLATGNNGVLVTSSGGVPSISSTLPAGLTIPTPLINEILDTNGAPIILLSPSLFGAAVNYFAISNGATNTNVILQAEGSDSSIGISIAPKDANVDIIDLTNTVATKIRFFNAATNHFTGLSAATNQASSVSFVLPAADGSNHYVMQTDGSANLSLGQVSLTAAVTGILPGANGGTGVNNGASLLTYAGNVTFSGAHAFIGVLSADTDVTFPTSGTLATTAGTVANATNIATTAVNTNATWFPLFVASSTNSNQAASLASSGLGFNPSTGTLTATAFSGPLTGNVTGNASGSSGSCTGNAATASAVALGGITGFGTGVATALAINVGSAGAPVLFNGAGGTPSSMTATNLTGTASGLTAGTASAVAVGGITGLGTGVATALAINIGTAGSFVTNGGALGTPSSGTLSNCTFPTLNQNTTGTAGGITSGNANVPALSAYDSGGTTLAANGYTKINLASTNFTTIGTTFSSSRFTPTKAGIYQMSAFLRLTAFVAATLYTVAIYKNGSSYKEMVLDVSDVVAEGYIGGLVSMNGSTDYLELYGYNGHAATTETTNSATFFDVHYVGPTS